MGSVPDETLRATVRVIVIAIGGMVVGICQPESQLPKEGHANTRERTGRLLNFILAFRGERKCSSARQMGISDAAQRVRGGGAALDLPSPQNEAQRQLRKGRSWRNHRVAHSLSSPKPQVIPRKGPHALLLAGLASPLADGRRKGPRAQGRRALFEPRSMLRWSKGEKNARRSPLRRGNEQEGSSSC
ncbi:hypothetical protein PCL_06572 [Purpureocillium lilacinum]|uniref:Uncharacterized protein n=1 Tax=Purpureocillium lilacinum TaxID=33203 RepID=A0A2U3EN38_PURLI|nr:hypothetical protein PCL_06572 [Purpureocillium lilacinum]